MVGNIFFRLLSTVSGIISFHNLNSYLPSERRKIEIYQKLWITLTCWIEASVELMLALLWVAQTRTFAVEVVCIEKALFVFKFSFCCLNAAIFDGDMPFLRINLIQSQRASTLDTYNKGKEISSFPEQI